MRVTTGDVIHGWGWTFDVLHTPGHISNHLCFGFREERALFSGDHVMGWATTIIPPPDGDVVDYLASLELLFDRDDRVYWPTHGPPVYDPDPLRACAPRPSPRTRGADPRVGGRGHRPHPRDGPRHLQGLPRNLRKPAGRSVLAHLVKLVHEGRVVCSTPEPTGKSRYRLA